MFYKDKSTNVRDINAVRYKKRDKHNKRVADISKAEGDIIHLCKLNRTEQGTLSTSSATSFCTCCNGLKSTVSGSESEPTPLTKANFRSKTSISNKHISLGCQTNLGKEIIVELAVYHGDRKVVSENFEFPNSAVTDKTVISGKAFEIYCEIVNEEMLQVWGVEKNSEDKSDQLDIRHSRMEHKKERILKNARFDARDVKMQALMHWAKAQTDKCKTAILEKYDEIWKMLDRVTVEALNEVMAKETELMQLIEEVAEIEINVTDYNNDI